MSKPLDVELEETRRMLDAIADHPQLQAALTGIGYDQERIDAFRTLYDSVAAGRNTLRQQHSTQIDSTLDVRQTRARLDDELTALSQMARGLLGKDVAAMERLGLRRGQRGSFDLANPRATPTDDTTETIKRRPTPSRSQATALARGRVLLSGIASDPTIADRFTRAGYTPARLAEIGALITQLEHADTRQELSKGTAKNTTASQRAIVAELRAWMVEFRQVVKAGLRQRPDLLELLGM